MIGALDAAALFSGLFILFAAKSQYRGFGTTGLLDLPLPTLMGWGVKSSTVGHRHPPPR